MKVALRQFALAAMLVIVFTAAAAAHDVAVIVNKQNTINGVGLTELAKMCKTSTRKWGNGRDITVYISDPSSPRMRIALKKIFGMTPDQVRTLAETLQARNERPPLIILNSDEVVVRAVQSVPGAIGLVDVYSITGGIRVIKVDGKTPLEPGYALHGH